MIESIPQTQRVALLTAFGQPFLLKDDYPVKQPSELAPGECLVKLEYTGVCHSDIDVRDGGYSSRQPRLPLVCGHEGVGHVVAIGAHTGNAPVKVGDRVGLKWCGNTCLKCEMCRKGHESSCAAQTITGYTTDGTFANYAVSYTDYVTPIPGNISSAAAAPILCAGMTVYKALKQSNTKIGNWVAISGAGGGLGHLGVQYAVAMGLRVIAIDTGDDKRELVLRLGAEKWIDFRTSTDIIGDVRSAADGLGPHAAIVAASTAPPFSQAVMYLRPTGTLVTLGMVKEAILNVPVILIIVKSLHIVGSAIGNRQDAVEALDIAAQGKVKCHYEVKKLEDLNSIFTDMRQGKIVGRIVVKL